MILAPHGSAALLFSLLAVVAYLLAAWWTAATTDGRARGALLVAWLAHAAVLMLGLLASPAHFGFAPALSATMWLVLGVFASERHALHDSSGLRVLALLCAAATVLAQWLPGPQVVTLHSAWLPLHWALGFASYGLFGAALVHAGLMERAERRMRKAQASGPGLSLLGHERLAFRFVAAGFVLLSATLVAGWMFGEQLHGQGGRIRWDHKMVFSHLSWFTFACLLVGRLRFGWRGKTAARVLYAGCALLLLAYVGSRFVLQVVLGRGA
jgi:ABC-type uncharacterized transport system permease subunit